MNLGVLFWKILTCWYKKNTCDCRCSFFFPPAQQRGIFQKLAFEMNEKCKTEVLLFEWCISNELFYRSVARQVSSPQQSLTSVFGMGTGGPSAIRSLIWLLDGSNKVNDLSFERRNSNYSLEPPISHLCSDTHCVLSIGGSSPRSISIGQLNTLLCLHLRPIKLVVCKWPYSF